MNAGELDRRIEIQRATITRDDWNSPVETWATIATTWAAKRDRNEIEINEQNQTVTFTRTIWKIRHRADLTTTDVILYGAEVYDITGIRELGRREALEVTTEKRK
jgi:SPP1 family predicted phage head-tail adaptor